MSTYDTYHENIVDPTMVILKTSILPSWSYSPYSGHIEYEPEHLNSNYIHEKREDRNHLKQQATLSDECHDICRRKVVQEHLKCNN